MQPTTLKKVYRLSYTTLELWARGEADRAIASYLGKPHPYTHPMLELGKTKHKLWESEILRTGCMPVDLGGQKLNKPEVEKKHIRDLDLGDRVVQLVGVIDVQDGTLLEDHKVSLRSPSAFLGSPQKLYYKLLIPEATRFEWRVWNPLTQEYGVAWAHLDDSDIDAGLDWVLTYASDFIATYENMIEDDFSDNFNNSY